MVKNKHIIENWMFLAVALLCAVAISFSVRAQDNTDTGNGLRITPVRQELILAPGQRDSYSIDLTNVSQGEMNVVSVINDFESDNETGQPKLLLGPGESSPFSIKEFVILPESFPLEPGETMTVSIEISMPSEVKPGGYFGAIRFAPGTETGADEGTVALTASVASLLLISVPGDVPEGMTLENIQPKRGDHSSTFFESPPDVLAVTLANTGNTILKPFGQVVIKDIFGNEVHKYEFNDAQVRSNVLPQSSRTFEDALENIGLLGRYTAEANLSFGEGGGTILQGQTTFWVIPWKILLAVIAVVAAIIWFATKGLKTYNRRVVQRAKRNS